MRYIWIEDQGIVCPDGIKDKLLGYCGKGNLYLAYFTDGFLSGDASEEKIKSLPAGTLLEIRIFCDEMEILARRSSLGENFKWRLASDRARTENFKKYRKSEEGRLLPVNEDMTYMICHQVLDIKKRLPGNHFLSMVGGTYILPLRENENTAKVMTYLAYDERGMAAAVDFRLCGFAQESVEVRRNG